MPRPPRVQIEGALQYVTSVAMEGGALFRDAEDYQAYLEFLWAYRAQFGFKLFAFLLLPDHVHLCVEPSAGTTMSAIMQALNSRYTKYYAKRYGKTAHVFQDRFKLTLVEKAPSLLRLTGFLHRHPACCGGRGGGEELRWSSLAHYLAAPASSEQSLNQEVHEVLQGLASAHPAWSYQQYLDAIPAEAWERLSQELREGIVGSPAFVSMVQARRKTTTPRPSSPAVVPVVVRGSERRFPMLTASLALAFVSLCAAGLYATNLDMLKQTVRVMAQERALSFGMPVNLPGGAQAEQAPTARLASFSAPAELNGVIVDVEVHPLAAGTGATLHKDRLDFRGGRLTSRQLNTQGFLPSHYNIMTREDGTAVWETVQADRGGAMAYWRGEWDGRAMRGVLTQKLRNQPPIHYSFVGATQPTPQPIHQQAKEI